MYQECLLPAFCEECFINIYLDETWNAHGQGGMINFNLGPDENGPNFDWHKKGATKVLHRSIWFIGIKRKEWYKNATCLAILYSGKVKELCLLWRCGYVTKSVWNLYETLQQKIWIKNNIIKKRLHSLKYCNFLSRNGNKLENFSFTWYEKNIQILPSVWNSLSYFFFPLASTVLIGPWPSLMDFSIHRHLVGLLGWGISPTQGLYLHRTTQHRNTQTHIHAPSRIRTCDLNVQGVVDSTCHSRVLVKWIYRIYRA
jgi:hypothetical protein